jgi:hypothetical protein
MPPKVRKLKAALSKAGFSLRPGPPYSSTQERQYTEQYSARRMNATA